MKLRISKTASTAIKLILSLSALAFVIYNIDMKEVLTLYKRSNAALVIFAVLFFALSKFIAAFRLNHFLRHSGVIISDRYNLRLYLLGMFYNMFLPGGIGGDGYKIYILSKNHNVKAGRVFWTVLTDRVSGILALFCLAVILSLFIHNDVSIPYKNFVWLFVPLAIFTSWILLKKLLPHLEPAYFITTVLSFGVQLLQLVCAYIIFKAIGGQGQEISYLFIFLISSIVAMLPISIGGIGTREITFLFGAQILGLDQNISIAMSLMFYLITMLVSFGGIYYSVKMKGARGRGGDDARGR